MPVLQPTIEKALSAQLTRALQKPLQEGFRNSFQQLVLPAFEAACQNLFSQVSPQQGLPCTVAPSMPQY